MVFFFNYAIFFTKINHGYIPNVTIFIRLYHREPKKEFQLSSKMRHHVLIWTTDATTLAALAEPTNSVGDTNFQFGAVGKADL